MVYVRPMDSVTWLWRKRLLIHLRHFRSVCVIKVSHTTAHCATITAATRTATGTERLSHCRTVAVPAIAMRGITVWSVNPSTVCQTAVGSPVLWCWRWPLWSLVLWPEYSLENHARILVVTMVNTWMTLGPPPHTDRPTAVSPAAAQLTRPIHAMAAYNTLV
ncbi:unnamed protein product [Medioppia subpectinata]|uniref:Uncharacterized protein n=1 Tax=Medioppia subpectinata TaxID=1979941 RepID=A0A7R9KHM6_9ACAR|nr:unnamed protein product [Medioppia subpectinata]CAG2103778.1 unnamed protein product [Medioppia subpectinata]